MQGQYCQVTDRMQSALAVSHHIQMRIAGAIASGRVNKGVAQEVARLSEEIADQFLRASQERDNADTI
jgi:hypothetical protein